MIGLKFNGMPSASNKGDFKFFCPLIEMRLNKPNIKVAYAIKVKKLPFPIAQTSYRTSLKTNNSIFVVSFSESLFEFFIKGLKIAQILKPIRETSP